MPYISHPLHSSDGSDIIWTNSKLSLKYKNRTELYITLANASKWNDICLIFNDIPENDIRSLATVLNDCPQWARRIAFQQLKAINADHYTRCISAISEYQINKAFFDPENTFPCVATDRFLKTFKEGDDMPWEGSQIKRKVSSIHHIPTGNEGKIALSTFKQLVILDCIAKQLVPSDINSLLVVIRHKITARWRRKYMNLFRQLPEHHDWIEKMRDKGYDVMLVGNGVEKLRLHIYNSRKYPIDDIIVWLAVVPAAEYQRTHNDRRFASGLVTLRLYSDGNVYEDEVMSDDEMTKVLLKHEISSIIPNGIDQLYHSRQSFEPQCNMFAIPTEMRNGEYVKYPAPGLGIYGLSKSNWVHSHNAKNYSIKTLFYVGKEYKVGTGMQLAVARFHQDMLQLRSFHPPLIEEEAPLYYYKLSDMEVRSCPQITGLMEASGDSILLHVKMNYSPERFKSYSIPLDIKDRL